MDDKALLAELRRLGNTKERGKEASRRLPELVREYVGDGPEPRQHRVRKVADLLHVTVGRIYQMIAPNADARGRRAS